MKNYSIKENYGYYSLYINGRFYGTYDTFREAVDDLEEIRKNEDAA